MGVIEEKKKEKEEEKDEWNEKEREQDRCLPYCMFEEGTPGCQALSNQAHWDYIVSTMQSWRRQMRKPRWEL